MKKNTLLIFIAILLVGGSFVFAEYRNKRANEIYSSANAVDALAMSDDIDGSTDTDGDGSKDWEEVILETDPNDAQSKPGSEKSALAADYTKSAPEKLTQIDRVGREFFARYMELRQLGGADDKTSQEDLAMTTASGIVLSKPADYSLSQILTKADDGKAAVEAYGREVAGIFKKYVITSRNEAIITKESMEKEDPSMLKEIDPIIVSYKNIVNALIKVVVPQELATLHLDLVNAMNGTLFVAQSFRSSDVDAIKGVQAVAYYQVVEKKLLNSITALKNYFINIGINEPIF